MNRSSHETVMSGGVIGSLIGLVVAVIGSLLGPVVFGDGLLGTSVSVISSLLGGVGGVVAVVGTAVVVVAGSVLFDALLSEREPSVPHLDHLRHHLQTHFPVLYAEILEPTLADLHLEHSAALAEGCPWKARRVLLQGCGALVAAAVCQLSFSFLGRIAALWKARSPK